MSYLVLARKYRPVNFAELIGQEHVTHTLANAFQQNKVGQAYIFTGTRGVGKTTLGRILAKALRCEDPNSLPGQKNYGIPCNACESCTEINDGSALDVLEIDGASNNGVDNVREIRENVKFLPSRGDKKIYIIDEVHMLTDAAFNALLKTLEEPPEHVVFLFATTEIQKVPATILSRCQRYDLKRVPKLKIAEYLSTLIQREGLKAHPDALQLIGRKADGSVRDALSLMDQVVARSGAELTYDDACEALGVIGQDLLLDTAQSLLKDDAHKALLNVHTAFDRGFEMKQFTIDLSETIRIALLIKVGIDTKILEITADERSDIAAMVDSVSLQRLQATFQVLTQSIDSIMRAAHPRSQVEITLVRCAQLGSLSSVTTLLTRLANLEKKLLGQNAQAFSPTPVNKQTPGIKNPQRVVASQQEKSSVPIYGTSSSVRPGPNSWKAFVSFVTQARPNIGSLLEHAIPLTPAHEWSQDDCKLIRLSFRENQTFFYRQAKMDATFKAIEKLIAAYLGGPKALAVEQLTAISAVPSKSSATLNEKKTVSHKERVDQLKKDFLQQDVVKSAKDLFGAEMAGFDVNTSSNTRDE